MLTSCVAASVSAHAQGLSGVPMIMGKILWPGHDLSKAQVRLHRDREMSQLYDVFPVSGEGGTFVAVVEPGEFYLMAVVDLNRNDKLDAGDGLGYFGVSAFDPATQKPRVIRVPRDGLVQDVQIAVVATIDAEGKPVPVEGEPAAVTVQPTGLSATVRGKLVGRYDVAAPVFVALLAAEDSAPAAVARVAADAETFTVEAIPGTYQLVAFADLAEDGRLGAGDRFGAYGVPDWSTATATLPPLELDGSEDPAGLEIALCGRLGPEGRVTDAQGAGGFRLDLANLPGIVCGVLRQPAGGHSPAQVRVTTDPGMGELAGVAPVEAESGAFVALLPAGTYYLMALVDTDGSGNLGPGDLVGFHGVTDLTGGRTTPITVGAAAMLAGVEITVTGRVSDEGGLAPLTNEPTPEGTTQQ